MTGRSTSASNEMLLVDPTRSLAPGSHGVSAPTVQAGSVNCVSWGQPGDSRRTGCEGVWAQACQNLSRDASVKLTLIAVTAPSVSECDCSLTTISQETLSIPYGG